MISKSIAVAGEADATPMLTVAAIRRPLRTIAGDGKRCTHALGRNGGFGCGAWQESDEFLAAQAADNVGGAERLARDLGEELQHCITGRVSASVVDGLEVVEVEDEHADGRHAIPTADRDQAAGGFKESTAVQQPGQLARIS